MIPINTRLMHDRHSVVKVYNASQFKGGIPVVILAANNADTPMRYQVIRRLSSVIFSTLEEAQNYCRRNGWVK